jgi:hypothetical protein
LSVSFREEWGEKKDTDEREKVHFFDWSQMGTARRRINRFLRPFCQNGRSQPAVVGVVSVSASMACTHLPNGPQIPENELLAAGAAMNPHPDYAWNRWT